MARRANTPGIAAALLALSLAGAGGALAAPSGERQAELLHRVKHDCGSCHGLTMKGGLGPSLLPARLAARDDGDLMEVILDGMPGTPMPPWRGELSEDEARWIVRTLKEGLQP
jgi:cytochrome c55X